MWVLARLKSIRRIKDFAQELNKLGIPIQVKENGKCSKCRQKIGYLRSEKNLCSVYPCLNSNCGNFCDYSTIKETWEKMEMSQLG